MGLDKRGTTSNIAHNIAIKRSLLKAHLKKSADFQ